MSDALVRYAVRPVQPAAHLFEVVLHLDAARPDGTTLRLPSWIPGSYTVREFARNVVRIDARDEGREVALRKVDKDTWQLPPTVGPVQVRYEVYAWDLSVRTAHLDRTHAFFNGTSLLLMVEGHTESPHELEILPPDDPACAGWRVATSLPRIQGETWGYGRFRAQTYDELVDHPFELGTFDLVSFEACGTPHHVAITGRHRCDTERLARDLARICSHEIGMFGGRAPFESYLFLVTAVGAGYGGLEHRSSTALICKRDDLPQRGAREVTEGYRGFLGLCSHEYFHSWNVKRIKPRAFVPYDLNRENHTTLLWAFEGITSYYDDLVLRRAGLVDDSSYLELLGRTATGVQRTSGRTKQSVSDASFDAWTRFYKQDENSPNALVSYYTKGALVALALDLHLRQITDDRASLDTVMHLLWERFGDGSGVPEDGVEAVASEVAGRDLTGWFDRYVRSTEDPPLPELLETVGVRWNVRRSTGDADRGGKPGTSDGREDPGDLGVTLADAPHGARLKHVLDGGAAQEAGLSAGDVIIALDGLKVDKGSLTAKVRALPAGTPVTVHAFRRDELVTAEVTLKPAPTTTVWLEALDDTSQAARARREAWLQG